MRPLLLPASSALSVSLALAAQAPGGDVPRFAARADLVVLSATALDRSGRPVVNLKRDELRVFDEGRPQRIVHFSHASDLEARMLLLVDVSGSMDGQLKTTSVRMAALQLMAALAPEDQVALAAFDHKYWGVVAFTRDRRAILEAFEELQPFSSTALHDALDRASADLATHGEGRRAVVVITDGVDTASQKTPDEVLARSRALDVPIYAVSVLSPLDDPRSKLFVGYGRDSSPAAAAGAALLARYAQMSGGTAIAVSDFAGLRAAAGRIAEELKNQYRLGYDPPEKPPRFRRVEVRTTRKGVVVRTRSGYMPPS